MEPVFIWQTPAEWLMPSALQERITARSSEQDAMCGIQSENHWPDWPCCFHSRFEASRGDFDSPIAVMTDPKLSGRRCPASLLSSGFGS